MPEDTVHELNELKEHIQLEEAIVQLETDIHGIVRQIYMVLKKTFYTPSIMYITMMYKS